MRSEILVRLKPLKLRPKGYRLSKLGVKFNKIYPVPYGVYAKKEARNES